MCAAPTVSCLTIHNRTLSFPNVSVLFSGFFNAFQDTVVPGAFLLTVNSFHSLPRFFHRCSLYQQNSRSWCLVSESLRNLLVSFHLGKYRSDKQITFQKSRRIYVCDSFPVTFFSRMCLHFDVFITRNKDLEGIHKLQEKAVIAF